jgi:hypothetical protein
MTSSKYIVYWSAVFIVSIGVVVAAMFLLRVACTTIGDTTECVIEAR